MSHTRLWTAAAILALALVIGFALSVPHTRDISHTPAQGAPAAAPSVTLRDSFTKGLHTIAGTIEAPNACTTVTADATTTSDASGAEGIAVSVSMPKDVGVCLQLPTAENFSVTVSAPAHAPITVTVNGAEASTTFP